MIVTRGMAQVPPDPMTYPRLPDQCWGYIGPDGRLEYLVGVSEETLRATPGAVPIGRPSATQSCWEVYSEAVRSYVPGRAVAPVPVTSTAQPGAMPAPVTVQPSITATASGLGPAIVPGAGAWISRNWLLLAVTGAGLLILPRIFGGKS